MRFAKQIGARCNANDGGFCSNFELTGVFSRGREIGIQGIGLTQSMARWETPEVGSTIPPSDLADTVSGQDLRRCPRKTGFQHVRDAADEASPMRPLVPRGKMARLAFVLHDRTAEPLRALA